MAIAGGGDLTEMELKGTLTKEEVEKNDKKRKTNKTETETLTITETETLSLLPNCCDGFGDITSNTTGGQYTSSDGFNVNGFAPGGSLCHYLLDTSASSSNTVYTLSDSDSSPTFVAVLTLSYPIINGLIRYIAPDSQCWVGNLEDANSSNEVTMVKIEDYVEPKTFYDLQVPIDTHNANVSSFSGMSFLVLCCSRSASGVACLNQVSEGVVLSRCLHSFIFNSTVNLDGIGDGLKNLDSSDSITTNDEAWDILEGATVIEKNGSLGIEI